MTENGTYCEHEDCEWATIIRFRTVPDAEAEHCVCEVLEELRERNRGTASKNVVLDMVRLDRMPSCLLGALVAFRRVVVQDGGRMLIANCTPQLNELLNVCQLHRVFDLCRTVEDALQRLRTLVVYEPSPGHHK